MINRKSEGLMGLPYSMVGAVLQQVAGTLVDRGHDYEEVQELLKQRGQELDSEFWDEFGGPATDWLGEQLGIGAFPEDDEE